ncbi:hypothetical protein SAMN02745857_01114 [Andreprevotia lacus DSM 23236]|jgi:hypothetical protein|uniref:Repeat domain-containing protein n=1 Tax=Andreprevotia lacus DSM 23236 TaxID=1121001 RepID=A0A1W1XC41_9NEIS|nr:hypothetical protein [Andreprevotia lacus]SMC21091.1 hypothetical protein SAMN02745857_01114 [Andreprevotia lacus DSM 23236]
MPYLHRHVLRATCCGLLLATLAAQSSQAADGSLQLALPGSTLAAAAQNDKHALTGWYALSITDGVLNVTPAESAVPSDTLQVSGKRADQLLAGKPLQRPPKPGGLTVKSPPDALLLLRVEQETGKAAPLPTGQFAGSVAPDTLREGWAASGELAGRTWHFAVAHKKRPDGKLLAGSLRVTATPDAPSAKPTLLLPPANGMAFARQELLWLGDMNNDGQPDALVRRTWVTGEADYVLVVSPMLATAYYDPDHPASYFSSGVEPGSNIMQWHKSRPVPGPIKFVGMGNFSLGDQAWRLLLPDAAAEPLPKVLTDRQFKLNGETIRVTLEHLPRTQNEAVSTTSDFSWDGSVLVRVTFRGKSQVLMQAAPPDDGQFALSVGLIDGKIGVKIEHQPHYNNSFTRYWLFDDTEAHFRRLQSEQAQGC